MRIAIDLLTGGCATTFLAHCLDVDLAGLGVELVLVGPAALRPGALPRGARWEPAEHELPDDPQLLRAARDASLRVATALVRDGRADVLLTAASRRLATAAAEFGLGRLPGATTTQVAVPVTVRGRSASPVSRLLAATTADDASNRIAVAAAAALFGRPEPTVGLLDPASLVAGGGPDVSVAEPDVIAAVVATLDAVTARQPALGVGCGPTLLLGPPRMTLQCRDATALGAVTSAVRTAAAAVRTDVAAAVAAALTDNVARRRAAAGLAATREAAAGIASGPSAGGPSAGGEVSGVETGARPRCGEAQ